MLFRMSSVAAAAVIGFMFAASAPTQADQKFNTIGTGGQTGVYYQVGGVLTADHGRAQDV